MKTFVLGLTLICFQNKQQQIIQKDENFVQHGHEILRILLIDGDYKDILESH